MAAPVVVNEETEYTTVKFKLVWTLRRFRMLYDSKESAFNEGITMQELGVNDIEGRWRIYLDFPKGMTFSIRFTDTDEQSRFYTGDGTVFVLCRLRLTTGTAGEVGMVIESEDFEANTVNSGWHKFFAGEKNCAYDFMELVTEEELFGDQDDRIHGQIQNDCVHVSMDVTVRCLRNTRTVSGLARSLPTATGFARRQLEWLQIEDNRRKPTDFILCSSDKQEFHVHRSLLIAHSPVFEAMVSHDTKEKQLSRCDLTDEDGESVGLLLDYLYAGGMTMIDENNAEKMLSLADKYQLKDMELRKFCEVKLVGKLNKETAVPLLIFANQRNLTLLVQAAVKLIPQNMGEVLSNKVLVDLMNRDELLMKMIMEHCGGQVKLNAELYL